MKKLEKIKGPALQELPENWGSMVTGGLSEEIVDGGTYGTKKAGYCGNDLHLDEVGDSPD